MTLPTMFALPLGMPELIIILVILLVLFGGSKLPSLAKGLGQSMKEFKKAQKDEDNNDDDAPKSGGAKKVEPASRPGAN
jgi:sec-independent protein translocase protein TatA